MVRVLNQTIQQMEKPAKMLLARSRMHCYRRMGRVLVKNPTTQVRLKV